jgi:HEAT repeat protein
VRETSAQVASSSPIVRDDTTSLARLLDGVRGVNPFACELAARSVDMHGWWSNWGDLSGNPLETDSISAALIMWIQRDHNDPAVVPRLRAAMRDADRCVRRVAGSFLGRVQHPSALSTLLAALEDASADTRQVAIIGIGVAEERPGALQPLIRRLRDESPAVRRVAAWALGRLEDREALAPLIELLERDTDPRVRQAAAWAIGEISG